VTYAPSGAGSPAFFVAFGTALESIQNLSGRLLGNQSGTIIVGNRLVPPYYWVLLFEEKPAPFTSFENDVWTLEVFDRLDKPNTLQSIDDIEFYPSLFGGPVISYPQQGNVCPSFSAYGTSTAPPILKGTMTDNAGNNYPGNIIQNGSSWVIQFNGIPAANNPYSLAVTDSTPPPGIATALSNNLTVVSNCCVPS
jgi:hypothetical protein